MKNPQILEALIELFLQINPQPSDQQFHMLAESVGVDHETLEAISYRMLGQQESGQPLEQQAAPLSKDQEVLVDDYDPGTTSPDRVALNDSAPNMGAGDARDQADLYDDGGFDTPSHEQQLERDDVQLASVTAAVADNSIAISAARRLMGQ
ncbi:hypothetical protein BcepSauron_090 [Burkholderia phage BcepSauron]|uniref:Uncharacterized protein n=1 Tax=Burkholderia phage BcepSauron TaxID=2530033 RepID=A0A482MN12_9CAUD|nr:hypothetical protein H1O17_gp090 [Burkholderia phage BcepSauron]QBQ74470.1 hypothetical protein BcepSauron_090 [Burkholderia phage BcepSauron]